MLKRILVGLDGSPYAKAALDHAIGLAKTHGASISGVAVVDTKEIDSRGVGAGLGASCYAQHLKKSLTGKWRERTRDYMRRFEGAVRLAGVPYQKLFEEGVPFKAILEDAKVHDLLVLGLKTYFHGEGQEAPGDTLARIARHAVCPVLAVSEKVNPIRRVLAAVSGDTSASRVMRMFLQLQPWPGVEVVLLHVGEDERRGDFVMNAYIDYVSAHGLKVEPVLLHDEDPGKATLREAADRKCDAIVIGGNHHMTVGELIFGSNTDEVIRGAQVPVFLHA